MENSEADSGACDVDFVKPTAPPVPPSSTSSLPHRVFMTEDPLELIFSYLDTPSLKHCRLVCRLWTPLASRFLMRKSFCMLPSTANDSPGLFYSRSSLTSVKINGALLSRISSTMSPPSSFQRHWKSVSLSFVPSSSSGISSLVSFLNCTSSSEVPQLSHLKIQFADDPKTLTVQIPSGQPIPFCAAQQAFVLQLRVRRNPLPEGNQETNEEPNIPATNVDPISSPLAVHSLHLIFEEATNIPQVSAFLRVLLRKETLPQLKELVAEFSEPRRRNKPGESVRLPRTYREIMETLGKCEEVLGSLRVLRIVGNVPLGVWSPGCPRVQHFMRKAVNSDLPQANVTFGLSKEIRELQWGSGLVALQEEDALEFPNFLPGVLTPNVAAVLQTLDLSGFYLSDESRLRNPSVTFPQMPCLRKLTAEEVAVKWIKNFGSIFEKAQNIREFKVKNTFPYWNCSPFVSFESLINFDNWESAWGLAEYPSLLRLEFGYSVDVKYFGTLQKMSKVFPNVEVLQFTCDDKSRRLRKRDPHSSCQVDFMLLQGIVEGLKEWKSLRHLKVTYWPSFSVKEMLDHFYICAGKLSTLRLYDFRRSNDDNPVLHMEELRSSQYLLEMMQKVYKLDLRPHLLIVLQNFHCPHEHSVDESINRIHKCSVMEKLFEFAEEFHVSNFRKGMR